MNESLINEDILLYQYISMLSREGIEEKNLTWMLQNERGGGQCSLQMR